MNRERQIMEWFKELTGRDLEPMGLISVQSAGKGLNKEKWLTLL